MERKFDALTIRKNYHLMVLLKISILFRPANLTATLPPLGGERKGRYISRTRRHIIVFS